MVPPSPSPPASSSESSPPEQTNTFVPRPFPPPSLAGIPLEYVINSLRRLAPQYWNNTETADCSIIYPLNNHLLDLSTIVDDSSSTARVPRSELLSSSHDPSSMGRRLTAPNLNRQDVRMLMKLHIDYLSAQSTLLRALFSGASPLDLIHPATQPSPQAAGRPSISASVAARLPRLIPSPDHPIVYLPLPDPSSFPYLVSWMYFGDTTTLDDALQRRVIRWDGLARNVEYLGMPEELKRFLGRWYRRWLQSVQQPESGNTKDDENDETPRGRSSSREHSTSPH